LVLVVDATDEASMQRLLVSALASHGFRCLGATARAEALTRAFKLAPDLVLLDVGSNDVDASGIAARLRESTPAPVLVLLARSRSRDGTVLLDAGASDYIVKPVLTADLVARMRVWLRQPLPTREPRGEQLRIDPERRLLFVDGREVHLTPIECKVLVALARRRASMKEEQIVDSVWGKGSKIRIQHLRAHLRRLRQKIERDPSRPACLVTDTHGGYRLRMG
jgi:two-component system KDP operon response regulator KdpE